jgi:adenine deaminase
MTTEKFEFNKEAGQRQHLTLVALGKRPADILIRGVTFLNVFTLDWHADHDIVVSGDRIAWIGPTGYGQEKSQRFLIAPDYSRCPVLESHINILRARI